MIMIKNILSLLSRLTRKRSAPDEETWRAQKGWLGNGLNH